MYEDAVWARVLFLAAALIFAGFVLIFKKARLLYIPIFFALGVLLLSGVIDVRYGVPRFYELRCARHEILR